MLVFGDLNIDPLMSNPIRVTVFSLIKPLFSYKFDFMGYIFDFKDAIAYEQWLNHPQNRYALELENRLVLDLLKPMPGETVLDIGCGTGSITNLFVEKGLHATGIDPSPYMLDIANKNVKNRADFHRGTAEDLPFEDNAFNHACLINTLEFVDDPDKAIREASRVAKDRIFMGVVNKYAMRRVTLQLKGMFSETIYSRARFFSIWDLRQTVRSILGNVPFAWRTICHLPPGAGKIAHRLEKFDLLQRCPFGSFAGMVVTLVPRFRTKPLPLSYSTRRPTRVVAG